MMQRSLHEFPSTLLTDLQRSIFDGSPLGIVERDMDNRILYANKAALEMMGSDHYEGLTLADIFSDEQAKKVLADQTEERRKGLLGNYQITLTRLDNAHRKVDVEITGLPMLDHEGTVVGSLGIFRSLERQRLREKIRQLTLMQASRDGLLKAVAETVRSVLPFDLLLISQINADDSESEVYFVYPPFQKDMPTVWFHLSAEHMSFMEEHRGGIVDFEAVMRAPPWDTMDDEPMVQQMRRMALKTSMWRQVRRAERGIEKMVASITLLSTRPNAYDEKDLKLFNDLPLVEAVLRAQDNEQDEVNLRRLQLFKDLNHCITADQACALLAHALVEMFGWFQVSLFRVDHSADLVCLVYSADKDIPGQSAAPVKAQEEYEQHITAGVLGRVVASSEVENIGDVRRDRTFLIGPNRGTVVSELAVPIVFANRVRFIINVDDPRIDAFSSEHARVLKEIAHEVAGALQRITDVAFLTECFDNASDPIIATDAKLRIRKVNPAAAALFGLPTPDTVQGRITDYFEDPEPFEALKTSKKEKLGELQVKQRSDSQPAATAFVTRKDFPDTLGGHVFIARDLRDIRRAVQLEFLEAAAYEIAIETQAPLTLATAYLEKLVQRLDAPEQRQLEKALRQLGRVKNSYTRLAMYNREARKGSREICAFNLNGELQALRATLGTEELSKVDIDVTVPSIEVEADHAQVTIVLESLLSTLLRAAPETGRVRIRLARDADDVVVTFKGKLPPPRHAGVRTAALASIRADLRRADPLLRALMRLQGGSLTMNPDDNGETEFVLRFPPRRHHA
jgi:PAS domain S-box-containing protein